MILIACIVVFAKNLLTGIIFFGTVIPANVSTAADDVTTVQQGIGGC